MVRAHTKFRRPSSGFLLLLLLAAAGCGGGSDGPPQVSVSGKVTFEGQPVERGEITFEDASTGVAKSATLGAQGAYTLQVPQGTYQVGVTPPSIEGRAGPDTPSDFIDYEKVDDIPPRYYWGGESGLAASVSEDSATHDFDMKR